MDSFQQCTVMSWLTTGMLRAFVWSLWTLAVTRVSHIFHCFNTTNIVRIFGVFALLSSSLGLRLEICSLAVGHKIPSWISSSIYFTCFVVSNSRQPLKGNLGFTYCYPVSLEWSHRFIWCLGRCFRLWSWSGLRRNGLVYVSVIFWKVSCSMYLSPSKIYNIADFQDLTSQLPLRYCCWGCQCSCWVSDISNTVVLL